MVRYIMTSNFGIRITVDHARALAWVCQETVRTDDEMNKIINLFIQLCIEQNLKEKEIQYIADRIKEKWKNS